ncbi:unnamed protein product [Echinostoma caproni]|uniref:DKCLD domain-containing protein n=1 Tax=Echinostoma caproni TaxID=27848 RepID=A0A183APJ8_9TREM|nr:unnamed protein product [Echinostoma caproni]
MRSLHKRSKLDVGAIQASEPIAVISENKKPVLDCSQWPLLLKNVHLMNVRECHFEADTTGYSPLHRPIDEHIQTGVINLDKPSNPSSHEVVAWVKRALGVGKTGHSGTLDPKVTGCLIVCIDRATRLVKSQQSAGKVYIGIFRLHEALDSYKRAVETLSGALFQRPPLVAAVKRQLRVRTVYENKLLEYDKEKGLGKFVIHAFIGRCYPCHIVAPCTVRNNVRRGKGALVTANLQDNLVTMHDVLDAKWLYDNRRDESYLRRVIMPLERLLTNYKRIMLKDTAVSVYFAIYFRLPLVCFTDDTIALMTTATIATCDHGLVAKLKRVIMERDLYPRQWGRGPVALERKKLVAQGLLSKYAKSNEVPPIVGTAAKNVNISFSIVLMQCLFLFREESSKKKTHKRPPPSSSEDSD